jgi:hypothetical protein
LVELEKNQGEAEKRMEQRILAQLKLSTTQAPQPKPQAAYGAAEPKLYGPKELQLSRETTGTPTNRDETGRKIHEAFKELLKIAETKKQTFLVGIFEQLTENGAQKRPLVNYKAFVESFFEGARFEMGKLGRAMSTGLPLGRVVVHPEDVHTLKLRIRDGWRNARDLGWWVGQENPVDLRQMETNAFRFIMETKTECDGLRKFYLEVDEGFLRFQGAPFLPVYMVPSEKELWPKLAPVLLLMVESLRAVSWVDRFRRDLRKLDPALLEEWNCIIKCRGGAVDEQPLSGVRGRRDERLVLMSKLNFLGRTSPRTFSSKGSGTATHVNVGGDHNGGNKNQSSQNDSGTVPRDSTNTMVTGVSTPSQDSGAVPRDNADAEDSSNQSGNTYSAVLAPADATGREGTSEDMMSEDDWHDGADRDDDDIGDVLV